MADFKLLKAKEIKEFKTSLKKNFFGQFIHWDKIFEFFSSTKAEWGISIIYLNHSHLS